MAQVSSLALWSSDQNAKIFRVAPEGYTLYLDLQVQPLNKPI